MGSYPSILATSMDDGTYQRMENNYHRRHKIIQFLCTFAVRTTSGNLWKTSKRANIDLYAL
jgi:hypothetical protein